MTSPPFDSTQGHTTSGVSCYHRLSAAQAVRRRRAWHAITALGQHTWSDDVGRGMPSPPLDSTHGRTTRAWHDITTFGQHTQSNDVSHGMPPSPLAAHTVERCRAWHAIIAYGRQTRLNDVKCDMPSPPLDSTHGRMLTGRACHHRLWAAHTVERRRAWHAITALGQHT